LSEYLVAGGGDVCARGWSGGPGAEVAAGAREVFGGAVGRGWRVWGEPGRA